MSSFSAPFNALVAHFEKAEVNFHVAADENLVFFTMGGDAAIYSCRLRITHDNDVLQIDLGMPVLARQDNVRGLVAEMVARANRGLPIGRFDIDLSEGLVSFHIGHAIAPAGLDDDSIARLFGTALATADRYFPALMRVMYGGHTPADAVYLAELAIHSNKMMDDASLEVPASTQKPSTPPAAEPPPKKRPRRARKNTSAPKSSDRPGLFDPAQGEGTHHPPTDP